MSGSGREKGLKTVEVKKCYKTSGMNRALQETKELDKIKRENRGQDLKKGLQGEKNQKMYCLGKKVH